MNNLPLLGRIFVAIPFLMFGIMHLMNAEQMAGMAPFGGEIIIYITGLAQIAAGIAFLSGIQQRLAGLLTALLMALYAFTLHLPGVINAADDMAMQMSMGGFLKDLGLLGGALLVAATAKEK